eukprot:CAMPEP_0170568456 /NCGR_PEP_ID=MMETSP0211-20121228/81210_1 /TAXON_ID=311385 /ORGANISM="Pseudokeronopsis sp., Strain OXSARD2" /LENGTH=166 /DNA_ID=CAMNT_0010890361 /DNA_START=1705 /DNA_END=2201 /DNA_ORIENTATION=-
MNKKNKINENLLKILERVELDRPILMKEKFDVLWYYDKAFVEKDVIHQEIEKKKHKRTSQNKKMTEKYFLLLEYIYQRFLGMKNKRGVISKSLRPHDVERQFMDFLRIIIQGGWVVKDHEEWYQIFDFLGIESHFRENKQVWEFFKFVAQQSNFLEDFLETYEIYS